jgi:hypothetical protein
MNADGVGCRLRSCVRGSVWTLTGLLVFTASTWGARPKAHPWDSFWQQMGKPAANSQIKPKTARTLRLPTPPQLLGGTSRPLTASGRLAAALDTCDGYWQGTPELRSVGWILGQEVYASYQNPVETGCQNPYPFTVTDVFWAVVVDGDVSLPLQPVIASNQGTADCPYPGILLCLGQEDTVALSAGAWILQMPLNMECSVAEPYFACVYLPDAAGAGIADLIFDADTLNPLMCRSYDDWGEGWQDLAVAFPNMILFSQGEAPAPTCACDCHGDPQCDSVATVADVVQVVNVAFRSAAPIVDPNAQCPRTTTDVNCDGVTTVSDVVLMVNVAFRSGSRAANVTDPCP